MLTDDPGAQAGESTDRGPSFGRSRSGAGRLLGRSLALVYLIGLVLVPLGAIVFQAMSQGPLGFWKAIANRESRAALSLTLQCSGLVALIDAIAGVLLVWTLERTRFSGRWLLSLVIDLPFAVPTVVVGLTLVSVYGPESMLGAFLSAHGVSILFARPGILLALLFVTLPFVVRATQPVLATLDRAVEEAGYTLGASPWTVFRRLTLPSLMPAVLAGSGLALTRALGEFGSVVLVAGNLPFRTETAAVYVYGKIEADRTQEATAVSITVLALSFTAMWGLQALQRRRDRMHAH